MMPSEYIHGFNMQKRGNVCEIAFVAPMPSNMLPGICWYTCVMGFVYKISKIKSTQKSPRKPKEIKVEQKLPQKVRETVVTLQEFAWVASFRCI